MESQLHSFCQLFAQLGLPSDREAVDSFIADHAPLPHDLSLADADFWTPAQAAFLRAELAEDADWSAVVDSLDARLRHG